MKDATDIIELTGYVAFVACVAVIHILSLLVLLVLLRNLRGIPGVTIRAPWLVQEGVRRGLPPHRGLCNADPRREGDAINSLEHLLQ